MQLLSGPLEGNPLVVYTHSYKKLLKHASDLNYGTSGEGVAVSGAQSGKMITLKRYKSSGVPSSAISLRQAPEPIVEE